MDDTKRLDWLEKQNGCGLISDDAGRWAISTGGFQNVPDSKKRIDIFSTFFVEAKQWRSSIRKAIDYAIRKELKERGKGGGGGGKKNTKHMD